MKKGFYQTQNKTGKKKGGRVEKKRAQCQKTQDCEGNLRKKKVSKTGTEGKRPKDQI